MPIRLLLVAASDAAIHANREERDIRAKIRQAKYGDQLILDTRFAVGFDELFQALLDVRPSILHFSGHGNADGEILLLNDAGRLASVPQGAFEHLIATLRDNIRLVVLNACFSDSQARQLARHVECVIGMSAAVNDEAAIQFAANFYHAIAFGRSVKVAFELGCTALRLRRIPDAATPRLSCRDGIDPDSVFLVPGVAATAKTAGAASVLPDTTNLGGEAQEDLGEPRAIATARDLADASRPLLAWPKLLGNGKWLDRDELRVLQQFVSGAGRSVALLTGAPGTGKSALLARLAEECLRGGIPVLAIKADTLPTSVDSEDGLAAALGLAGVQRDLRQLARGRTTVVLLDQLDALATIVDLKGGRLNVLLNLVRQLRDEPNVRIICSCRTFERNHDARLQSLDAEMIELSLPSWDAVASVLSEVGIESRHWPDDRRNLLRYPQWLKVFVEHLRDVGESSVFRSYQALLEELWRRYVLPFPNSPLKYSLPRCGC